MAGLRKDAREFDVLELDQRRLLVPFDPRPQLPVLVDQRPGGGHLAPPIPVECSTRGEGEEFIERDNASDSEETGQGACVSEGERR